MSSGGSGSQVVGYRYYFGIHMGVCRGPVDELVAIKVGDKLAWSGSVTSSGYFAIDNPNLFGGDKGEGGIQGTIRAMFGEEAQTAPDELEVMTGTAQPAFRRKFTLFFDGLISALNPYPKAWKMRVRRVLSGWQAGTLPSWGTTYGRIVMTPNDFATLGSEWGDKYIHAMNPALIIYECLTNKEWGRGLSAGAIDNASFAAAAQTLWSEGFGLCIKWSRKDSIRNFIRSILDHVAATIYTDRSTGKITLKLIRDDYTVGALPLFTPETGLLEVSANDVVSPNEQVNVIQVKYRHAVTNETRIVRSDSLGGVIGKYGVVNASTKDYPGIPTASLALRVAERDLRIAATSLRRYTFRLDRRGYAVYPGQAIRIAHPALNIPDTVVRVGKIEDNFGDGNIKVTAVQDVFGLPSESFGGSVGSTWTPPDTTPCVPFSRAFEVPYFLVARYTTASEFAFVDATSAGIGVVADKGKPLNGAYDIAVRTSAPTSNDNPPDTSYNCPI